MYRGDRRRKEDARKAERKETGETGPEMGEAAAALGQGAVEWVWFSPSKGRTLTTSSAEAPNVPGVDDWTLVSGPPAQQS